MTNLVKPIDHIYESKAKIRISQSGLRLIAMISMLIDHIGIMLIKNGILYGYDTSTYEAAIATPNGKVWYVIYVICRMLGRIAFPIFCFLMVEAVLRSKNIFKYLLRLAGLALISEIPFNLMSSAKIFFPEYQNTVITLLAAALMLYGIIKAERIFILQIIIAAAAFGVTYFLKTDYSLEGIILALGIYYFRLDKKYRTWFITIFMFIMSLGSKDTLSCFGFGALAGPIIHFYNGKLGYEWGSRSFYYLFYPVHLLILFIIIYLTYMR